MKLPNTLSMSPLRELINWIARPYDFLDDCAKSYGDIFTLKLMGFPAWVMLSDPQAIGEIFATDAKQFDAGKNKMSLKSGVANISQPTSMLSKKLLRQKKISKFGKPSKRFSQNKRVMFVGVIVG